MIQRGTSIKILVGFLVLLAAILIGVSVFITARLQQNQAPVDSSAGTCGGWVCTSCGCGCNDAFLGNSACCVTDEQRATYPVGSNGIPSCAPTNPPPGGGEVPCRSEYFGNSFRLIGTNCSDFTIQRCTTSYSGGANLCPVTTNCRDDGDAAEATYNPDPEPGTCEQVDYYPDGDNGSDGGGVCECEPPVDNPVTTVASSCPAGSTTPVGTISWSLGSYPAQAVRVDISNSSNFGTYWSKNVASGITSTDATGFTSSASGGTAFTLTSGATYYVRVHLNTSNKNTATATLNTASCTVTPPPTASSNCPVGATNPIGTINWSKVALNIDFDTSSDFSNGFWSKNVSTITSNFTTTTQSGFTGIEGETQPLVLNSGTTYYVRVNYGNGELSNTISFNAASCTVITAQCIDLAENGPDPIASGIGNKVEYTLIYLNSVTTNPYPNIKLRVGTTAAPVGRDAQSISNTLVDDYSYTFDTVTQRHIYRFRWEAASTAGVGVAAGSYDVRVLLDGATAVTSPANCLESITVSQTVQPEPLFNIVKSGGVVCEADGDARIDYTITASNIGSVSGIIDFVEDKYDTNAVSLGIIPTSINPTYGSVSGGKITWTGDTAARTYSAGQSKAFTYSLTIPIGNILTFTAPGVVNQAKLQYDTLTTQNNSTTFDLRTLLSCSTPSIPNTGIFDDFRMLLVGIIFIGLGLIVYRSKIGYAFSERILGSVYDSFNNTLEDTKNSIKPYEETIMEEMESKAKGRKRITKRK